MKKTKISNNVIRRLPRYLRKLDELAQGGAERISSKELGNQMGLTPSQIRQDFSCFGEFGQQGWGYSVPILREEISSILGIDCGFSMVLVGVGNLGHALMNNFDFVRYGFSLIAAFDVDPALVGTAISGTQILHADELEGFLQRNRADIAVLTVPREAADATAGLLTRCGVRAIWNFTNKELEIQRRGAIIEDIHFSDSLLSLGYFLAESLEQEEGE